jgi:Formyl transferase
MKVVLLTADGGRHRWLARQLAQETELAGIVVEPKGFNAAGSRDWPTEEARDLRRHFAEREAVERRFLGEARAVGGWLLGIEPGSLNSTEVAEWVRGRKPDLLVLFGTGIMKSPLLDMYRGRVINLHLGLSPYYRGSGTNFWPFVFEEPECVGATIHVAEMRVDAGAILAQVRPDPEASDRIHELGTKALIAGGRLLPRIIRAYEAGKLAPQKQDLCVGRTFRSRDFNVEALRRAWQNLDRGLLAGYVGDLAARQAKFPVLGSCG